MPSSDAAPRSPWLTREDVPFGKVLLLANGAVPAGLLAWDAWRGQLGANPVNDAIRTTGMLALVFLLLTLAITPLRRLTGWAALVAFRRLIGLTSFFYLVVHFALFVVLDRAGSVSSTVHEIVTRRHLQVGAVGLVAMVPLAVTSTDAMIRRLGGQRWRNLHRLTYVAAVAAVAHYALLVKADLRRPLAFAAVLAVLLAARPVLGRIDRPARPARPRRGPAAGETTPAGPRKAAPDDDR